MTPKQVAKAIASALVGAAAYLAGVVPATGGFDDVTTVQWLGLVVFIGAGFGITWAVPNGQAPEREPGDFPIDEEEDGVTL